MSNQGKQSPLAVNVTSALLQSSGLKINGTVTTYVGSSTGVANYTKGSVANETVLGTVSDVVRLAFPNIAGNKLTQATYDSLLAMGSSIPALANSKPAGYAAAYTGETTSYGFMRMPALIANNEFKFNNGTYSDFVSSYSIANGYKSMLNKQINTLVNGKNFLDGVYSNMDDLISADITGVNLATVYWGQDLINTGRCINLNKIDKFGTPSVLLLSLRNSNGLTKRLNEELVMAGLDVSDILLILGGTYTPTTSQESKIYTAFTQITNADLKDVLIPLNVQTKNITSLADLLNPLKLFPSSYISLTVAKYNTTNSPTNSKIYYLIYANGSLNPQLKPMNFGKRLIGMIPDQIAIPCDAFSVAMMQIKNIKNMNIEKFSQVVTNLETATTSLTQVNGTGGTPADSAALSSALSTIAKGSGTNGTYRTIDFFGAMSGLPYDYKKISDAIKALQSSALATIYNNMKSLLSSPPVTPATDYNSDLTTLIGQANTEITRIYNSNVAQATALNTLWSAMGTQLGIEVTARANALTTGATTGLTEIMSFVDSVSGIAMDTDPYQSAQVLEAICDLSTKGGNNIIALMREARNAKRLGLTGGVLDNDIPDTPSIPIGISTPASGPLTGLTKITGASNTPGSFGGSPETKLVPANLDIFNISPTTLPAVITPKQAVDQVIACNCDCWDQILG
jgi:hypothetical protein